MFLPRGKGRGRERGDAGRPDRHAGRGTPRRRVPLPCPERVLRQFAGHCRREGHADGSIVKEAVEDFLYGRHLKGSTIRREEIVLRDWPNTPASSAGGRGRRRR